MELNATRKNFIKDKKCKVCGMYKDINLFYRRRTSIDGHYTLCKECYKKDVIDNKHRHLIHYREADIIRKRFNFKRLWQTKYYSMKRRINGLDRKSKSIGKELISLNEFLTWCYMTIDKFDSLYIKWVESGFKKGQSPSVDRIDNNVGYTLENMQWLTQSNNSKKSNK